MKIKQPKPAQVNHGKKEARIEVKKSCLKRVIGRTAPEARLRSPKQPRTGKST